ncbi:hypothetical protein FRC04_011909 [Tulasnella sp. 424]|nr:hypothetical protein FRC04_011909 [Tulasnella sp. 424]KAG8967009.1 hypothetical protein FRC05_002323 [Tulasnella sp. 425]
MSPISIAIAGATGDLGRRVARRFLSSQYYPSQVAEVKFFTRNASSAASQELIGLGVKAIDSGISAENFKGVDVFVSVLGEATSLGDRNAYVKAAAEAGVKVYIPTEFGIDHRKMPFEHPIWELKLAHDTYARSVSDGKLKVVSIFVGLFLDDTFPVGPALGLDTLGGVYTSVLSPDTRVSFLSRDDIASSVARISVLATANPASVPDYARINGSSISYRDLARLVGQVRGEEIKLETMGEEEAKAAIKSGNFWVALRYTMGYGLTDFSTDNANEVINPGESQWKWKTVQEYVEETKGVAPENKQLLRE